MKPAGWRAVRSPRRLENLANRHQAIIDGLQTHDPEIAGQAMWEYVEGFRPPP